MSIPNTFRPLGRHTRNRVFPMVRLTSNNTGRTVDGHALPNGFAVSCSYMPSDAFKAFDGKTTEWLTGFWELSFYEIDFGRRVELKKIRVFARCGVVAEKKFNLQYWKNGGWHYSGAILPYNQASAWTQATLDGIVARKWRLYRAIEDTNTSFIAEIDYEAVY